MLDYLACIQIISIHALREEGDTSAMSAQTDTILFLSTPSARRATGKPRPWRRHKKFSIHALREEGDILRGGVTCEQ